MQEITQNTGERSADGILRCSRYAFGPNRLHYCGPDRNSQIYANIKEEAVDPDLTRILTQFETMYPYLCHIAAANHIALPLDDRVVEAYWIGNGLLERIDKRAFHRHLVEGLELKKKFDARSFAIVEDTLTHGAVPHHSFHVFDVWQKAGAGRDEHTLESMDECRISWGKVASVSGPVILVDVAPLLYEHGKLTLGAPIMKKYTRQLESDYDIEQLQAGDIVTIHWSVICEKISARQAAQLNKYTLRHIALANLTL